MAYGSPQSNKYLNNLIRTEHINDANITTAKLANDAVTDAKTATSIEKTLKFSYSFDVNGGDTAAKVLAADLAGTAQQLPSGAILKCFYLDIDLAFASSGSATIMLGHTGVTDSIMAATAFDNAALTAATIGWELCAKGTKLPAAKNLLFTIAGAALTGGEASIYITYQETIA